MIVGEVKSGQSFAMGGRTYRRVGSFLNGQGVTVRLFGEEHRHPFATVRMLPFAHPDGLGVFPQDGHQNAVVCQDEESGGFYFVECSEICELSSTP